MEQLAIQLDLFRKETPITVLTERMSFAEHRIENARKGLFSRFNDLSKKYIELTTKCDSMRVEIAQLRTIIKSLESKMDK